MVVYLSISSISLYPMRMLSTLPIIGTRNDRTRSTAAASGVPVPSLMLLSGGRFQAPVVHPQAPLDLLPQCSHIRLSRGENAAKSGACRCDGGVSRSPSHFPSPDGVHEGARSLVPLSRPLFAPLRSARPCFAILGVPDEERELRFVQDFVVGRSDFADGKPLRDHVGSSLLATGRRAHPTRGDAPRRTVDLDHADVVVVQISGKSEGEGLDAFAQLPQCFGATGTVRVHPVANPFDTV